jgi:hypothetical protein
VAARASLGVDIDAVLIDDTFAPSHVAPQLATSDHFDKRDRSQDDTSRRPGWSPFDLRSAAWASTPKSIAPVPREAGRRRSEMMDLSCCMFQVPISSQCESSPVGNYSRASAYLVDQDEGTERTAGTRHDRLSQWK